MSETEMRKRARTGAAHRRGPGIETRARRSWNRARGSLWSVASG
ncbi:hypothetical protein [Nonomuraea dietziae]